ncbi:hypothetical protein U6A24_20695 [Aquimarina gracilis]|uniref:Uncharacterized protein n=1 Tax=Aquimarina gracilis TaxID=874422 RepID=A0ABU6A173_9FLAO|nr:hypothetical protein [Aquimarina gracilis]MEB3347908.1 hypothetical protein [Aquimarina gracilis]
METTIPQNDATILQEEFKTDTDRWIEEDILKLANHFHKLKWNERTTSNQYSRVKEFTMEGPGVNRFNEIKKEITELKLHLALKEENKNEYTFYFILGYKRGSDHEEYIKLVPDPVSPMKIKTEGGANVPKIFKDMIAKNWDEIGNHLIDDLFIAEEEDSTNRVRVNYYCIDNPMVEYIKGLGEIRAITLYPGVDMNKFNNKKMISFAPTLGFKLVNSKTQENQDAFRLKGVLEMVSTITSNSRETERYVEYLRPCPPTCQ